MSKTALPAPTKPLGLFEAFGVELEYVIVDSDSLSVRPLADEVIRAAQGKFASDAVFPDITWSNELVLHVIELKTTGPAERLAPLLGRFQRHVERINGILESLGARLLPTAMHPWMNPARETRLWPHEYSAVYEAYDRIFDCRGHGWSNLQSLHMNLPFRGDEEFGKLHAAVRFLLPILPSLAAGSPIMEGRLTGLMDYRLQAYRQNQRRVPSITARVVPEPVFTKAEYREKILRKIYSDIAPYDPEGILREEWLNSRGAIARFERNSIEVRVLDMQECPWADLSLYAFIVAVLKRLVAEEWTHMRDLQGWGVERLAAIFEGAIERAEELEIRDARYLRCFGLEAESSSAADLWRHLFDQVSNRELDTIWRGPLEHILERGTLARRIVSAAGRSPSRARLRSVYGRLADCLRQGVLFE